MVHNCKIEVNLMKLIDCLFIAPELEDPVIDPRETWSSFLKRNIEFEEPPMVA